MGLKQLFSDRDFRIHFLIIFVICCINKLGFELSGNEDTYLGFAKQFVDPNWIPGSFSMTEFPGTRILFQSIVGVILLFLDIETVAFLGRLAYYFFISFPLALILTKLNFKWFETLIVFQLFVMSHQNFFAGAWIIGGFGPKAFAYVFGFYGLYKVMDDKPRNAAVYLAMATYFHFLIGGWIFFTLCIYYLFNGKSKWIKQFAIPYVLVALPLIAYLFYGYFYGPSVESTYNIDWVYAYFRNPHHVGLFVSDEYFVQHHLVGVLISTGVLILSILFRNRLPKELKFLNSLVIIMLSINVFFVGVVWVDVHIMDFRLSKFLKFYPFRTNSMAMLFTIIIAVHVVWTKLSSEPWGNKVKSGIAGVVLILGVIQGINNVKHELRADLPDGYAEMCTYINQNITNNHIFAIVNIPEKAEEHQCFIRLTDRELFYVHKHGPGEKVKMNRWYKRHLDLVAVNEDNSRIGDLRDYYGVDFAVSGKPIDGKTPIQQFGEYYLYTVD